MGNQTPGTDNAQWVTGHIPIEGFGTDKINIYFKNLVFNSQSTNGNHGIYFFDKDFNRVQPVSSGTTSHFNVEGIRNHWGSNKYFPFDADGNFTGCGFSPDNSATNKNVKYFCVCCGGLSDDSIITINEPID